MYVMVERILLHTYYPVYKHMMQYAFIIKLKVFRMVIR